MSDLKVLLVDDHDFTRSMEKRLLVELGVSNVAEARDGNEALALAKQSRPNVVISDLAMPGMDGLTFVTHVAQQKLADSLIIASGLAPGALKAVEALAVAYGLRVLGAIQKPLKKEALETLLYLHAHPPGQSEVLDAAAVRRAATLGQFKSWFMPVFDVGSMAIVALDAVPRWESPQHGVKTGEAELAPVMALGRAPEAVRTVLQGALECGAMWRMGGWQGSVTLPVGQAALGDTGFWDWLAPAVKKSGMTGNVALGLAASLFATDTASASMAVARSMMDGYRITAYLNAPADLDAADRIASCQVVKVPVSWLTEGADRIKRVHALAENKGADLGVTGVDEAKLLAKLHESGSRYAQGQGIGRAASAAETHGALFSA